MKSAKSLWINVGRCVLAVAVIVVFSQSAFCGTYGGGLGTTGEPFLISTAEHLQEIGANEDDWGMHFVLKADIDLSGRVYKQALIAPDRKSDDGFQGTAFTGVFNGNGHVIRNLTINTGGGHASYVGLFGFIDGSNAEVNNLGIENVNISSGNASWYVGGVVGYMQGYNTSSINNCYATGLVNGGGNVGVMVGRISGGNINNSFSAGIVRGDISVGGLVGHAYGGSISNCYSIAEVVGNRNIGGFIGQYYGCKTTNCYVLGSVSGGYLVGSLTGYVDSNNFHNCFWSSEINPDIWGIGNIGHPPGADNITLVEMGTESTFINVGWDFAGESSNGVEDLWYLPGCGGPALSWQSAGTVPSVTGRSASEAVSMISSFGAVVVIKNVYSETIAAGEVISQEPDVGCETAIVTINVSIGRPYGGGSGTEADPFEIWTAEQMNMIGINYDHWGKHFVLMADIDLSEYAELTYNVIGYINTIDHTAESFSGVFDGGGYVISNLTIEREDSDAVRLGLFGVISSEGTVKNLGVEHVNIVGDEFSAIGGIAGRNEGTISNCYVTGNFAGKSSVGCVAGINCGTISGCFAAGSVDGSKNIGGIVGHNSVLQHNDEEGGLIISCYAIADAVGREYVGVLVGNVYKGTVTNCYAEGSVTGVERNETGGLVGYGKYGNIFDSFWNCDGNIEISGVGGTSDHESVKQKSSEEMRMLNTFTQEGWDFVGEEDNGTEDIWLMPGAGTPALSWQSLGTVPDVEGLTQEDALSLIKSSGSVAIVETVRSKEVDAGLVISHEPAVGLEAALVRLFVSEGFPYAGGSGTAEYPYQISTSEHLNSIGEHKEDWDKHFVLIGAIDMSAYTGKDYNIIGNTKFDLFTGVFDGDGHVISNLTIDTEGENDRYLGLFGNAGPSSVLNNVGVEDVNIRGGEESSNIGGLVGRIEGTVINCYVTGSVSGGSTIGGLAGFSERGEISDSYSTGTVNSLHGAGGFVGVNDGGSISSCYSTCNVSGGGLVGGFSGDSDGFINNCYAIGNATGTGSYIGGFVGRNNSWIFNCYSTGNVRGFNRYIGGFAGRSSSLIRYCYTLGIVEESFEYYGGFVGYGWTGNFDGCFWSSEINPGITGTGTDAELDGILDRTITEMHIQSTYIDAGWDFVGEDINGTEDNWYMPGCGYPVLAWQGVGVVPDVTGLSEADAVNAIKSAGPVVVVERVDGDDVPLGYVVSQEPAAGCEAAVVTIFVSNLFPYEAGSGTEGDPYQIWTAEQMNAVGVSYEDWDKHFVVMADIDLASYTGTSYAIIGNESKPFSGVFDGNGYVVSNLTIDTEGERDDYLGLFGKVGIGGKVRDLNLENVSIIGGQTCWYVGCLAGVNEGTITGCNAVGTVSGYWNVGGLAGNNNEGTLINCYADCSVVGNDYAGGLVGLNIDGMISSCFALGSVVGEFCSGGLVGDNYYGNLSNCYAASSVSGHLFVGGLSGLNEGSVSYCYASGVVNGNDFVGGLIGYDHFDGTYGSCFWNVEANPSHTGVGNIDDPAGVMGRTSSEMQMQGTFIDAGWDFVGEDVNGVEDFWKIREGVTYPQLSWRGVAGDVAGRWRVDLFDLAEVAKWYGNVNAVCDFDESGFVDVGDLMIMAENWLDE